MLELIRKEWNSFFSNLTGYLIMAVFLVITGLSLWVLPGVLNIIESGYASLDSLFYISPWVFLFLCPAVTMRTIAEERKTGTLELLLTRPISETGIVLGKYFGTTLVVLFALLPCLVYIVSLGLIGEPTWNFDIGGTIGSMLGLVFLACVYNAIGIFISSLTENQIVSFILSAGICFCFYEGFAALSEMIENGFLYDIISYLSIKTHYSSISRGLILGSDLAFYIGLSAIFLLLTIYKIKSLRWK